MKILKPGVLKPKFWWLGKKFVCKSCGCEFELDESDWKTDDSVFTIPCPTCSTTLRFSKPTPPTFPPNNDLWGSYQQLFGNTNIFDQLFGKLSQPEKPKVKKEEPPKTEDITINAIYKWVRKLASESNWKILDEFFYYQSSHVKEHPLDVLVAYAKASLPYADRIPSRKVFIEQCMVRHSNPILWEGLKK